MTEMAKLPGGELERAAANVIEHAGKNIVDGGTSFASSVFNGLIGDRIREWRTRNMIRGAAETAKVLLELGVDLKNTRALPTIEFYSIFEGMSEQDDDDVSRLWAGLLASRMADEGAPFNPSVISTLKTLTGLEARILHFSRQVNKLRSRLTVEAAILRHETTDRDYGWSNELNEKFEKEIFKLREGLSSPSERFNSNNELDSLCDKLLLTKTYRGIYTHSITQSSSFEFGRVELVDGDKLSHQLNDIWNTFQRDNDITETECESFWTPSYYKIGGLVLTSFGNRFLDCCVTAKAE